MEKKRLTDLKAKEDVDAMEKLKEQAEATDQQKKNDLRKKEKKDAARKLRKEQKKKKKATKTSESGRLPDVEELLREEKGTDGDSEGELSEASKVQAHQYLKEKCEEKWRATEPGMSPMEGRKRKQVPKSVSVVESRKERVAGSSKRVKLEVAGPAEGEDKFLGNSEYFLCQPIRC